MKLILFPHMTRYWEEIASQVFMGAHFPADEALQCTKLAIMGKAIAEELKKAGVLGRFSIDFISVKENDAMETLCH